MAEFNAPADRTCIYRMGTVGDSRGRIHEPRIAPESGHAALIPFCKQGHLHNGPDEQEQVHEEDDQVGDGHSAHHDVIAAGGYDDQVIEVGKEYDRTHQVGLEEIGPLLGAAHIRTGTAEPF